MGVGASIRVVRANIMGKWDCELCEANSSEQSEQIILNSQFSKEREQSQACLCYAERRKKMQRS